MCVIHICFLLFVCVCVCVFARARTRARARVCVCVYTRARHKRLTQLVDGMTSFCLFYHTHTASSNDGVSLSACSGMALNHFSEKQSSTNS